MTHLKKSLSVDGYGIARQLFAQSALDAVRADIRRVITPLLFSAGLEVSEGADEHELHDRLVQLARLHPQRWLAAQATIPSLLSTQALLTQPCVLTLLKALGLDTPICPTPPICYFLTEALATPGEHHRAPPHQDWRYLQSSLDALTLWVPLVEVNAEMGVVELLPGSHRRGLIPTATGRHDLRIPQAELPDDGWVCPSLAPGDALVFSCLTVHRSGKNTSGRMRWALALRFANVDEPTFSQRGFPNPYRYQPTLELLTPGFPTAEDIEAYLNKVLSS